MKIRVDTMQVVRGEDGQWNVEAAPDMSHDYIIVAMFACEDFASLFIEKAGEKWIHYDLPETVGEHRE